MKRLLLILLPAIILFSCKQNAGSKLHGTWKTVHLENPQLDEFFKEAQQYIDTIGANNNAATNIELYGSTNIDSIRKEMQEERDSAYNSQKEAFRNTVFTFKPNNEAQISFGGVFDTCKWNTEGDSILVLEEISGEHKGEKSRINIILLTDKDLSLKFEQENTTSTVTFKKD